MQQHGDEALVAYLDGELDDAERREVDAQLDADPAVRERLMALAQAGELVRGAYADIVDEPVPPRLIAAARGTAKAAESAPQEAEILVLKRPGRAAIAPPDRRWRIGLAAAAGLFGVIFGSAGTYFGMSMFNPLSPAAEQQLAAVAANSVWLDNAAGYYKLTVSAGDTMLIDVPASNDPQQALQKISQSLPQQVRLPDLKPWGLNFRGARLVVVEGRPAAQLVYSTDNKAIGPLTLVIGASKQPDIPPTFDRRQDVNLLYWRHQGRAYALVGQTDIGYLWGIANDVAWQLDAI
jgi:anti-sigma factor RsiW